MQFKRPWNCLISPTKDELDRDVKNSVIVIIQLLFP